MSDIKPHSLSDLGTDLIWLLQEASKRISEQLLILCVGSKYKQCPPYAPAKDKTRELVLRIGRETTLLRVTRWVLYFHKRPRL